MIHYTPLDLNDVFPVNQTQYSKQKVIDVDGRSVLVDCLEDGNYRIIQLLSSNPQDFLEHTIQPGEMINKR